MDSLGSYYPAGLLEAHEPPCLSLYQPTHRHHPENQQDPIRFRNLVKAMEESLRQKYPTREIQPLLEPFQALADDHDFWNHTLDGLAVLGAPDMFRVYRLQRPVTELVIVADSFHTKPLMRIFQSAGPLPSPRPEPAGDQALRGQPRRPGRVELAPGVPRTITEALGEELTEPHLTVSTYGSGPTGPAMHHGQGAKKDEVDLDTERFFRAVDRAVLEHHSRPSGLPLIVGGAAGTPQPFPPGQPQPVPDDRGNRYPSGCPADRCTPRPRLASRRAPLSCAAGRVSRARSGWQESKRLGADELAQVAEATVAGTGRDAAHRSRPTDSRPDRRRYRSG